MSFKHVISAVAAASALSLTANATFATQAVCGNISKQPLSSAPRKYERTNRSLWAIFPIQLKSYWYVGTGFDMPTNGSYYQHDKISNTRTKYTSKKHAGFQLLFGYQTNHRLGVELAMNFHGKRDILDKHQSGGSNTSINASFTNTSYLVNAIYKLPLLSNNHMGTMSLFGKAGFGFAHASLKNTSSDYGTSKNITKAAADLGIGAEYQFKPFQSGGQLGFRLDATVFTADTGLISDLNAYRNSEAPLYLSNYFNNPDIIASITYAF